jgi:acyl transferase domain-containing protein/aryl carrier-like protein
MKQHARPLAIVGIGCRLPGGADSPRTLWNLLMGGVDAIVDVPASRWDVRRYYDPDPDRPGKAYTKQGGFLREAIDRFDPLAFGITPREAHHMDPQQRLLLEVTWEAFDDAGLPQEALRGREVGVFVGGFTLDSLVAQLAPENHHLLDSHSATGASMTMLSNRISYVFDLRGPSISVDSACSSSLMATHLACRAIWAGDCSAAVVGGVNVMTRPGFPISMCKGGFLSPLSRCMTFDERAAGYVRGEGAAVVILKPLEDAIRDGDRVYASIRATGANQDGRTAGISLPNRDAQAALIRRVLADAGATPAQVRYVEAHGTGTQAGDAAEASALDEVLREGRAAHDRVLVGSIKTNIGHLEAASGVAGLIKTALVLHHGLVPGNLHFERPNPAIPFDEMCIEVAATPTPLRGDDPLAGVNSFGYGGSNAHVVLQRAPAAAAERRGRAEAPGGDRGGAHAAYGRLFAMPLSARAPAAVRARAEAIADLLTPHGDAVALDDLGHTLVHRSSHHNHRLVIITDSGRDLAEQLRAVAAGERTPRAVLGERPSVRPRTAFVYTGMGPQWWAMGRQLMATEPVYDDALREVDALFASHAGWSLYDALTADEQASRIEQTQVAQPTNFAVQYALTRLWASWGIVPDAVIGHSVGEVASAWASGALTLEDAVAVSYHRSRLQQAIARRDVEPGAMVAAGVSEDEAAALCEAHAGACIAAINATSSVTFSGTPGAMNAIAGALERAGHFHRRLDVEVAYHSHYMDPVVDDLAAALRGIAPRGASVPLYSTVTGDALPGEAIDHRYFCRNMREPVRFRAAMASLVRDGYRAFVELGPHPVMRSAIAESVTEAGTHAVIVPSLRRREDERACMLASLGALYVAGHEPRWDAVCPTAGRPISLPAYPWQREVYWSESELSREATVSRDNTHPLLQTRVPAPTPTWRAELSGQWLPWLPDHAIGSSVVVPGAAYLEAALAMAQAAAPGRPEDGAAVAVDELDFHRVLVLQPSEVMDLHCALDLDTRRLTISSIARGPARGTVHASGAFARGEATAAPAVDLAAIRARLRGSSDLDVGAMYAALAGAGLHYGPAFRTIESVRRGDGEALVELRPRGDAGDAYVAHPTLVDGALQAAVALVESALDGTPLASPLVPVGVSRAVMYRALPACAPVWAHVRLLECARDRSGPREVRTEIALCDGAGAVLVTLAGVRLRPLPVEDSAGHGPDYGFTWRDAEPPVAAPQPATALVLGDERDIERLGSGLRSHRCEVRPALLSTGRAAARSAPPDGFGALVEGVDIAALDHVVLIEPPPDAAAASDAADRADELGWRLLELVRGLARRAPHRPALTVVCHATAGGAGGAGDAIAAICRVARAEYPGWRVRVIHRVDDEPATWRRVAADIVSGLSDDGAEAEVRISAGGYQVHRLHPLAAGGSRPPEESGAADEPDVISVRTDEVPVRLEIGRVGVLSSLAYRRVGRADLGDTEVEIQVEAAGVNFKDLLKYTGQLDPMVSRGTYFGDACGMECAGVITRVGRGVTRLCVGDRVGGMARSGCFASYAVTDQDTVERLPRGMASSQAVALFIPYLTAWYGLIDAGRLRAGETVLIHSAAGGVGSVAVEIARRAGATVIATAGTEEKHAFLRARGVDRVSDSRSLGFVEDVMRWTDGRGVDVVLSAQTGDAVAASVRLLARYGRFVDIGKRSQVDNHALPLRAFNEGLSYTAIDMDRMLADDPRRCIAIVKHGIDEVAGGHIQVPPVRVFGAADVTSALWEMARGDHIGRLVIDYDRAEVPVMVARTGAAEVHRDGSYVVTGGLDGFGREVARHLARRGAGGLILLGRRGRATPGAGELIAALEACGSRVWAAAVDVSDRAALARELDRARQELPPIRGVFHAAMVLADSLLADITRDDWTRVMRPKARGGWNLHHLTAGDPIEHFVAFSSVAVAIGNPGQGSYVAANAVLDGLAAHRRRAGLPGVSVHWGVLGEVGVVARSRTLGQTLDTSGMIALSTRDALAGLDRAMAAGRDGIGVFAIDWERAFATQPALAAAMYRDVGAAGHRASPALGLVGRLLPAPPSEWAARLADELRDHVAALLQVSPGQLGLQQSLTELGVDSLMAVELVTGLAPRGYPVTTVELLRGPTIAELAERAAQAALELVRSGQMPADALSPEQAEALGRLRGDHTE